MNYTHDVPLIGKRIKCNTCYGNGVYKDYTLSACPMIACPSCDGYGEVIAAAIDRTNNGRLALLPCSLPKPPSDEPPKDKETVKA